MTIQNQALPTDGNVKIIKIKRQQMPLRSSHYPGPAILPGCVSRRIFPGPACGPLPGTAYERMVKSR